MQARLAEKDLAEELDRRREKEKNDAERMVSLVRQNANLMEGTISLAKASKKRERIYSGVAGSGECGNGMKI